MCWYFESVPPTRFFSHSHDHCPCPTAHWDSSVLWNNDYDEENDPAVIVGDRQVLPAGWQAYLEEMGICKVACLKNKQMAQQIQQHLS